MNRSILLLALGVLFGSMSLAQSQSASNLAVLEARVDKLEQESDGWLAPSAVLGLAGAFGAALGTIIQRYWQKADARVAAIETDRLKIRDYLYDSLKWFDGGTQRRSIGISVIEASWASLQEFRGTWIAVLANQAIFLLEESGQKDAAHEVANLDRMMELLIRHKGYLRGTDRGLILSALQYNHGSNKGKGLWLDKNKVAAWQARV